MQYIVVDMEWNQAWPGSKAAAGKKLRGEIVQIGAVRLTQEQRIADEFEILLKPTFFKKMNGKIAKLTGIRDSALREKGVEFGEAIDRFRAWCGGDCAFLAWGFDDSTILRENLAAHGLPDDWTENWYNAQLIFNAQTDGASAQKALKTAMELMNIEATRPAHDALGDAFHTAQVCAKLDLQKGIADYQEAKRLHENGLSGAESPGCLSKNVYHGYADRVSARNAMSEEENLCPVCGKKMCAGRWYHQPGQRLFMQAECETDGRFFVRVKLVKEENGTYRASRLVYEPREELEKTYGALAEKPHPVRKRRRRSRRNSTKGKKA